MSCLLETKANFSKKIVYGEKCFKKWSIAPKLQSFLKITRVVYISNTA